MKLTPKIKKEIDKLSYEKLLIEWRFAPLGSNPMMQGETGEYWAIRMEEIKPSNHEQISREIGWD